MHQKKNIVFRLMDKMNIKNTGCLLLLISILVACSENNNQLNQLPEEGGSYSQSNLGDVTADPGSLPLGKLGADVEPLAYQLSLTLLPEKDVFFGRAIIDIEIHKPTDTFFLHGQRLNVTNASVQTDDQRFTVKFEQVHKSGVAKIRLPHAMSGKAQLLIDYSAPYSTSPDGIYKVKKDNSTYLFSQLEPIAGRTIFPGFDEPRFKTPFTLSITTRAGLNVITNTPETSSKPVANSSSSHMSGNLVEHRFATTKPLPVYLLAFIVGEFDVVTWEPLPATPVRKHEIPLRGIAVRGKGEQLSYALDNTRVLLENLENYFQIPYPYQKLDIIAVPEFAAGAMENAGAITYREYIVLLSEKASLVEKQRYAATHAHELAHQWFGNLVTPKWWDDIWLNESFASWIMYKAAHEWQPDYGFNRHLTKNAHAIMKKDANSTARQVRQPITSNDDIINAFDYISYMKGGGLLQMFERFLGEENVRNAVQHHIKRFAFGVADINDFMQSLSDETKNDGIISSFNSFLYQSGVPDIKISLRCASGKSHVKLSQRRYVPLGIKESQPQQWQIPFCYLTDKQRQCEWIKQAKQTLSLDYCPQYFMPNTDGAGYYRWNLDNTGWQSLLANIDKLNVDEQLSLIDNVNAAYRTGNLSAEFLLSAFKKAAKSQYEDVVAAPVAELQALRHKLLDQQTTAAYQRYITELYGPHLKRLGLWPKRNSKEVADTASTNLLRVKVVEAMALEARDTQLRMQLTEMAQMYLTEAANKPTLDISLVPVALKVAVQESGLTFSQHLKQRALNSADATFRRDALIALTETGDIAVGKQLVDELLLSEQVPGHVSGKILERLLANKRHRQYALQWLLNNGEAFLNRFSDITSSMVITYGNAFCDKDSGDKIETYFKSVQNNIVGAPRKIAEMVEQINHCMVLRNIQQHGFKEAL